MNKRAITPIIEQFFIFSMGVFLFSLMVISFRQLEEEYIDKTGDLSMQLAGEYASLSIMNLYELKSMGNLADIETTATIPHANARSRYYLELQGRNITITGSSKTATVKIPSEASAEGNAYTSETIKFTYSGGKINLNGETFD